MSRQLPLAASLKRLDVAHPLLSCDLTHSPAPMSTQHRHEQLYSHREQLTSLVQSILYIDADDPRLTSLVQRALRTVDPFRQRVGCHTPRPASSPHVSSSSALTSLTTPAVSLLLPSSRTRVPATSVRR